IGRRRQCHHAEDARAHSLRDRLDGPALAGGVAPLEDHDHPQALFLDPVLEFAQLDLQGAERLLVFLAAHWLVGGPHWLSSPVVSVSLSERSWQGRLARNEPSEGPVFPPPPGGRTPSPRGPARPRSETAPLRCRTEPGAEGRR